MDLVDLLQREHALESIASIDLGSGKVIAAIAAAACQLRPVAGLRGTATGSSPHGVEPPRVANLHAFARLYGVLRWYHPSDAAAGTDWSCFAIDGVRRTIDAPARRAVLAGLIAPFAPTVQFAEPGEAFPDEPAQHPSDAASLDVVAWGHVSVRLPRPDHEPSSIGGRTTLGSELPMREPHITGRIAFLVGSPTASYGESILGLVEHYHLGSLVGSTSGGTNLNIAEVAEPTAAPPSSPASASPASTDGSDEITCLPLGTSDHAADIRCSAFNSEQSDANGVAIPAKPVHSRVTSMAAAQQHHVIFAGYSNGEVIAIDTRTRKYSATLRASGPVRDILISRNEKALVAGTSDGSIYFGIFNDDASTTWRRSEMHIRRIAMTSDDLLIAACSDGAIWAFTGGRDKWLYITTGRTDFLTLDFNTTEQMAIVTNTRGQLIAIDLGQIRATLGMSPI